MSMWRTDNTTEQRRMVYGLNDLQRSWSTARLRKIMRNKDYHRRARCYFYAELLKRRRAT